MPYIHNKRTPTILHEDPVDPDSTDWVYFTYENWLHTGESISTHTALIEGGTIAHQSISLGTVSFLDGIAHANTYGVRFSVTDGAKSVKITHRLTTLMEGNPNTYRENIDFTMIIPVATL
jgi:hypothetical protein